MQSQTKNLPEKINMKIRKDQFIFHVVQVHIKTKPAVSSNENKLSKHKITTKPR